MRSTRSFTVLNGKILITAATEKMGYAATVELLKAGYFETITRQYFDKSPYRVRSVSNWLWALKNSC